MSKIELPIEGMTCEHCVTSVRSALQAVPGVKQASVQLQPAQASIELANGDVPREMLIQAVSGAGYRVGGAGENGPAILTLNMTAQVTAPSQVATLPAAASAELLQRWRRRSIAGASLFAPLVALRFFGLPWPLNFWLQAALGTAIQGYLGWPFYARAIHRRGNGSRGLDAIIAIVATIAWVVGITAVLGFLAESRLGLALIVSGATLTSATLKRYLSLRSAG
jgi:P-type Cu+ transporter